jgi:peroxiredoxin
MDRLSRKLDIFLDSLLDRLGQATAAEFQRLEECHPASTARGPRIGLGDIAPDFTLSDQDGMQVSLSERLSRGPVVLSFYRGGWCPFCTMTLRAMERIRSEAAREGANILMVSPQRPDESAATARRNCLHFAVLSDAGNAVARRYGLVWSIEPQRRALLERLGHDLSRINASPEWELPVAAGYVIAPDGRIVSAHLDPRVNHRMEPQAALEALRERVHLPAA